MSGHLVGDLVVESILRSLKIYCDNSAIVFFPKSNKSVSQNKYIDINYLTVRKHIKTNKVFIAHINTKLMITNLLTNGMSSKMFKNHVVV